MLAPETAKVYEKRLAEGSNGSYADIAWFADVHNLHKREKRSAATNAYKACIAKGYYAAAAQIAKDHGFDPETIDDDTKT